MAQTLTARTFKVSGTRLTGFTSPAVWVKHRANADGPYRTRLTAWLGWWAVDLYVR